MTTSAAELLGNLAVRLRKGAGLSQDGLKTLDGPSPASQNTLELGKALPTPDTIRKLQIAYENAALQLQKTPDQTVPLGESESHLLLRTAAPALLSSAYAALTQPATDRPITLEDSGLEIPDSWDSYGTHHHKKAERSQVAPLGVSAQPWSTISPADGTSIMDAILTPVLTNAHLVLWRTSPTAPPQMPLRGRHATFGTADTPSTPTVVLDPLWPVTNLHAARQLIEAMRTGLSESSPEPTPWAPISPEPTPWAPIVLLAAVTEAYDKHETIPVVQQGETTLGPMQILEGAHTDRNRLVHRLVLRLEDMTSDKTVFDARPSLPEIEDALTYLRGLLAPFRAARFAGLDADLADAGKLQYRHNAIRSTAQLLAEPTVVTCAAEPRRVNVTVTNILGAAIKTSAGWDTDSKSVIIADPEASAIVSAPGLHILTDPTRDSMLANIVYADLAGLLIANYESTFYAVHFTPR